MCLGREVARHCVGVGWGGMLVGLCVFVGRGVMVDRSGQLPPLLLLLPLLLPRLVSVAVGVAVGEAVGE